MFALYISVSVKGLLLAKMRHLPTISTDPVLHQSLVLSEALWEKSGLLQAHKRNAHFCNSKQQQPQKKHVNVWQMWMKIFSDIKQNIYLGPGGGTLPAFRSSIIFSMSLGVRSSWKYTSTRYFSTICNY